jgi:hypothetical protein
VRNPLAQVFVRERDVPRLLGDVDGHHPFHDRVQRLAFAQDVLLSVVDGFLAGEDAEPERDRKRSGDQRDDRLDPLEHPRHAWHIGTDAVHHFLEHHRVVALFDSLVQAVPVFR